MNPERFWNPSFFMPVNRAERRKMKITVCWEQVNEISVAELLQMAEDGYEFILQDGRISGIFVPSMGI
mgnify:CR=1 FL=1